MWVGGKQRELTISKATSENISLIQHGWEAKHPRWLMVLNSLFLRWWAWVPGLQSVRLVVVASGSAHGLWVDKPMALAEGLSCMLGVQILTGTMHRPFPGPGCTVETVHGLESTFYFGSCSPLTTCVTLGNWLLSWLCLNVFKYKTDNIIFLFGGLGIMYILGRCYLLDLIQWDNWAEQWYSLRLTINLTHLATHQKLL